MTVGKWTAEAVYKVVGDNIRRIRENRGIKGHYAIEYIEDPADILINYIPAVVAVANVLKVSPLVLFQEH